MRIFKQKTTIHGDYVITNNIQNGDPHQMTRYDIKGTPIRMMLTRGGDATEAELKEFLDKFHQPDPARATPNPELLECWQDAVAGRRAPWVLVRVSIHFCKIYLQFAKPRAFGKKHSEKKDNRYLDTLVLDASDLGYNFFHPLHFVFTCRLIEPFGESITHVDFGTCCTTITEVTNTNCRTVDFSLPTAEQAEKEEYPVEITERSW